VPAMAGSPASVGVQAATGSAATGPAAAGTAATGPAATGPAVGGPAAAGPASLGDGALTPGPASGPAGAPDTAPGPALQRAGELPASAPGPAGGRRGRTVRELAALGWIWGAVVMSYLFGFEAGVPIVAAAYCLTAVGWRHRWQKLTFAAAATGTAFLIAFGFVSLFHLTFSGLLA